MVHVHSINTGRPTALVRRTRAASIQINWCSRRSDCVTTCSGRCQLGYGRFVLVADWTRSGKSTLAAALAAELGSPLLPKRDQGSSHGRPGPTGDGAGQRLVLDYALPLTCRWRARFPAVKVHSTVPLDLARVRYRSRTGHRHAGHFDDAAPTKDSAVSHPALWDSDLSSWPMPPDSRHCRACRHRGASTRHYLRPPRIPRYARAAAHAPSDYQPCQNGGSRSL